MRATVEKLFGRYGREILVERDGTQQRFRGFFHHTGSKDWHNMEKVYTELGQIPRGQYLVLAPTWTKLGMGDIILCDERRFTIRRVEAESLGQEQIYSWALCVELGREDVWPM